MTGEYVKEVRFDIYCKLCKHEKEETTWGSVCDKCLEIPAREASERPINWEEKDGNKK